MTEFLATLTDEEFHDWWKLTDEEFHDWWNVRVEEAAQDGDEEAVESLMVRFNEAFNERFPPDEGEPL